MARDEKLRNGDQQETSASASTPLDQIRIVIADDHSVARQGLSSGTRKWRQCFRAKFQLNF